MVAGYAERAGEFVAVELGDQAQLDDIPLTRVQPTDRGPDQLLDFGPFGRDADVGGIGGNVRGLVQGGQCGPGPQPAEALALSI